MNYKLLLIKYINYIGIEEGATSIDSCFPSWHKNNEAEVIFTQEEWDELNKLNDMNGRPII